MDRTAPQKRLKDITPGPLAGMTSGNQATLRINSREDLRKLDDALEYLGVTKIEVRVAYKNPT